MLKLICPGKVVTRKGAAPGERLIGVETPLLPEVLLLAETEVSSEKIAAYMATHYRFGSGPDAVTLRIDIPSDELRRLYSEAGQTCGLFITAFNPFGQPQSDEANEAAHAQLGERLRVLMPHVFQGAGADPSGEWPPEKGYFALGIDLINARELGGIFHQDAVVWTGPDRVPRLVLLR
jgi:Protein of unknown function (DUF3293)